MSSAAATSAIPLLSDFLSSVPSQLTTALIHLGPYVSLLKRTAVVISWRSSWFDSWLVVGGWWALCLLGKSILRCSIFSCPVRSSSPLTLSPQFLSTPRFTRNFIFYEPSTKCSTAACSGSRHGACPSSYHHRLDSHSISTTSIRPSARHFTQYPSTRSLSFLYSLSFPDLLPFPFCDLRRHRNRHPHMARPLGNRPPGHRLA